MTPYCLCHSPSSTANLRWNFQAQPPDSSSPVRGNGTAVPRVRFGDWSVPPSELQSRGGSQGSHIPSEPWFCCWTASAALPVATAPWDANNVTFINFSQLDTCVCAPCVCISVPVPTVGLQKANCLLQDLILPPPWQLCRVVMTALLAGEEVLLLSSSISSAVTTSEKKQ